LQLIVLEFDHHDLRRLECDDGDHQRWRR